MVAALVLLSFWTFGSWGDAEHDEDGEHDEDPDAGTADAQDEDTSDDEKESQDLTNGRE
jgi:hypothetical protein